MKKILIVEDDSFIRSNIQELITSEGFEVDIAENGAIGLEKVHSFYPDLIISDVMMPIMTGHELLEALQKDPLTTSIPFIFLSAKADLKYIREGMNIGADDYIPKPFKSEELLLAINKRLAKSDISKKQMDNLKVNLTLSLPHELRTPLMSIIGFSELMSLDAENISPADLRSMALNIKSAGQRLLRLTENYLFFAELLVLKTEFKSSSLLSNTVTKHPKDLIKKTAEAILTSYKRLKSLKLELIDTEIKLSEYYLEKIIWEMLDNAVKFSLPETDIYLTSTIEAGFYKISIKNYGIGFTPEQMGNLGAFMQFDRKIFEQQGSGLGIAICKELLEYFEGSFTIESEYHKYAEILINIRLNN